MSRTSWVFVVLLSGVSLLGCGGSPETPKTSPASAAGQSAPAGDPSAAAGETADRAQEETETVNSKPVATMAREAAPEAVVQAFLDAMRNGDETIMGGLLTDKAWQETSKEGFVVRPPGAPSASYEVGSVEADKNYVYVKSIWTETSEAGPAESYDIVWVLREQSDGWRIAGMATPILEGHPPLVLNFEDPAEMKRKLEEVSAALSEDEEQEIQQARQPAPASETLR